MTLPSRPSKRKRKKERETAHMFQEGKEEKPYLTVDEAMQVLGCARSTLSEWMKELHIQPKKFPRDRRLYLSRSDVLRIKRAREQPWLAEQYRSGEPGPDDSKRKH
jgi:predicted DNA-binding transcriptional regulator AlpA